MAVFNATSEFREFKKYVPLLKKSLVAVLPGTHAQFVYYKKFPFPDKDRPCVLVDFGPKCIEDVKAETKLTPTASGKVTLNLSNQLHFQPAVGEFDAVQVKKLFESIGSGLKEVFVDATAVNAPGAATPAPSPRKRPVKIASARSAASAQPPTNAPTTTAPTGPSRPAQSAPASKAVERPVFAGAFILRGDEDAREATLKKLIGSLEKATLPLSDEHKKTMLNEAKRGLTDANHAYALKMLNAMTRTVKYPGVKDWALDAASRQYEFEFLTEQCFAITYLIKQKSAGSNQWDTENDAALKLANMLGTVREALETGLASADPEKVKAAYDAWIRLCEERKKLSARLKPLWMEDQSKRMLAEAGKSKSSHNVRVANSYGKDDMLEMAQMAEVQAVEYKKKLDPKNPLAGVDWHKKLEVAELAAIYGYSTADYTPVGQLLRAPQDTPEQREALKPLIAKYGNYIEAAQSGLKKLPPYSGGKLVRCTKSLWQGTIDGISTTGVHVEKSFMSVGTKKVTGFGDIEWHFVKYATGREISMFSLHQSEGEVLFPPGARFRFIRGVATDSDGKSQPIDNHSQFATHVTPATRVAELTFEQIS